MSFDNVPALLEQLVQEVQKLNVKIDAQQYREQKAVVVEPPVVEKAAKKAVKAEPQVDTPVPEFADVRSVGIRMMMHFQDELMKIYGDLGVSSGMDMKPSQYATFMEKCEPFVKQMPEEA